MYRKKLFTLLGTLLIVACSSTPPSHKTTRATYQYKNVYVPITKDYKVQFSSATFDSYGDRGYIKVCVERFFKGRKKVESSYTLIIAHPLSSQYESLMGKQELREMFTEVDGQLIMKKSQLVTNIGCVTGAHEFESVEVSTSNKTHVALNNESIYFGDKDGSLATLGYISKHAFLNKYSFTIDLSDSIAFKIHTRVRAEIKNNAVTTENTDGSEANNLSVFQHIGAAAFMVVITPFIIYYCLDKADTDGFCKSTNQTKATDTENDKEIDCD